TLSRVARGSGLALALASFLILLIHLLPIGADAKPQVPLVITNTLPLQPQGYLRVVANPWAEVWVDGKKLETTPVARRLSVAAGMHKVEFKNPFFQTETREITVLRDETTNLRVDLKRFVDGVQQGQNP